MDKIESTILNGPEKGKQTKAFHDYTVNIISGMG
jgi:hypothetical protein